MLDFNSLARECAPNVHSTTLQAVVRTESGFNPYAIGVVGGHLVRQPHDRAEAVATARALKAQSINFSIGLGQVNNANLARYGLTFETAFDPCENLRAGSAILRDCYQRAAATMGQGPSTLRAAFSCYYSGNFTRGDTADKGGTSYVQRVFASAQAAVGPSDIVPAIPVVMHSQSGRPWHAASPDPTIRSIPGSNLKRRPDKPHPSWDAFGDFNCGDDCN